VGQDSKNLLLAMALAMGVFLLWDMFVLRPQAEQAQAALKAEQAKQPKAQTGATAPTVPGTTATAPVQLNRAAVVGQAPRVKIETPRLVGSLNLKGARLDDLTLTTYRETIAPNSKQITLFNPSGAKDAYFAEFGWAAGSGIAMPSQDTVWTASAPVLGVGKPVTLSWANGQGQTFEIKLEVDEHYLFTVAQTVRNAGAGPVAVSPYSLVSRHGFPKVQAAFVLHEGPLGVLDGTLVEHRYKDLKEDYGTKTNDSTGGWIGITDKYWLAALIPDQKAPLTAAFRHFPTPERFQTDVLLKPVTIPAGGAATTVGHLFAGAKEVQLIDRYEAQLGVVNFNKAIDWGWFWYLTRPLFYVLDWLWKLFGNFGLAIIGLTLIVKLIMFPLANKGYTSMNKMKLVAPKMKELQERFKDDKPKMQQELMELYKKEKVNPLAGCLPIILQIPVFFALYKVLYVTIEMRHQPFFLWIKDLSAPDPLTPVNLFGLLPFTPPTFIAIGVLPIIMGVTMWLQQKLSPQVMDPIQQRVFSLMPIFMTIILAPFAAGLVLYWTVNNILSILQQWVLMKKMEKENAKAGVKPA
jgi:YidC/Oxa1 family membrane protein insertase